MKTDIRNNKNIIIGWLDNNSDVIIATHLRKGFVGRYVKSSNITFDKNGKIYCFGDGTQSLVRDADREV